MVIRNAMDLLRSRASCGAARDARAKGGNEPIMGEVKFSHQKTKAL